MEKPTTVWTEQIKAHLELLSDVCGHCPANEYLETKSLNEILEKFDEARSKFMLMCNLHGFKTELQPKPKQ